MEDTKIVELYWRRAETAIAETDKKYGKYCYSIAFRILYNPEDSEECVNDTYWRGWNCMPPHRPVVLRTFLGKITRNLALNRYQRQSAEKRGKGQIPLVLEELRDCVPKGADTETVAEDLVIVEVIEGFLDSLPAQQRKMFVERYWYCSTIQEIATSHGTGESRVKMSLLRLRNKLKERLEEEGVSL